jgi:hypothetical protein
MVTIWNSVKISRSPEAGTGTPPGPSRDSHEATPGRILRRLRQVI